jgi:hypothetical protein
MLLVTLFVLMGMVLIGLTYYLWVKHRVKRRMNERYRLWVNQGAYYAIILDGWIIHTGSLTSFAADHLQTEDPPRKKWTAASLTSLKKSLWPVHESSSRSET